MAGRKVFTSGEILTAADVNSFLMDQVVAVFADDAARSSAIPSPSEGMVTYREDANRVEVYDGSAFGAIGGILQVVSTTLTTAFSTTSTSFTDITGLSVSITPSSTSSKVFIMASLLLGNSGTERTDVVQLVRDSTPISVSTDGGANSGSTQAHLNLSSDTGGPQVLFLDSPATTSATTYKMQILTNADTAFVNRRGLSNSFSGTSSITVMEVAV